MSNEPPKAGSSSDAALMNTSRMASMTAATDEVQDLAVKRSQRLRFDKNTTLLTDIIAAKGALPLAPS
jgi:hypothetical protein